MSERVTILSPGKDPKNKKRVLDAQKKGLDIAIIESSDLDSDCYIYEIKKICKKKLSQKGFQFVDFIDLNEIKKGRVMLSVRKIK